MKEKIHTYLHQLEQEKDITILLACETGSRAWGFPSPDSDFDVRMIYVHPKDWYLTLNDKRDTIERMLENKELDITGWDLKKALNLLRKSNPPLLERIQSPIIYQADDAFLSDIRSVSQRHYSKIATIHHYLSMAKKIREDLDPGEAYKLKKLFYALRTAIACKWIIERDAMPPIVFVQMYQHLDFASGIVNRIDGLIEFKQTQSESYFHQGEQELFELIDKCITQAEQVKDSLPPGRGKVQELDLLFRTYISKHDH